MSHREDNGANGFEAQPSHGGAMIAHHGGDFVPSRVLSDQGFFPPAEMSPVRHGASVRDYIAIVMRHKWLVLIVMVLVAGTSIPMIWVTVVPEYRATSVVRVSPVVPRMIYQYEENGMVPLYNAYLNTQVSMISSPNVLQRVLDLPAVQNTPWFKEKVTTVFGSTIPPLQRLDRNLSVRARGNTELIDVSMSANRPEDAKIVVDAVVGQFIDLVQKSDRDSEITRLDTLTERAESLRRDIDAFAHQRSMISLQLGTDRPEDFRAHITTVLSTYQEQREAVNRERQLNEARLTRLLPNGEGEAATGDIEGSTDAEGEPEGIKLTVRYGEDTEWRRLSNQLEDTKHSLTLHRDQYGEEHPKIKQAISDIAYLEGRVASREKELDEPGASPIQASGEAEKGVPITFNPKFLKSMIADGKEQERQLDDAIAKQEEKVKEVGSRAQDLADIDAKLEAKRLEVAGVRERINVLQMESKAPGRVAIASTAVLPVEPFRDRRVLLTALALTAAFAGGLAAAFLRVFLDPSIRQAGDVASAVQMPFLGYLPKVRFESELWDEVTDELLESMRMIRTALLDRLPHDESASVLITSSGARAGKTSVALLLAKSLSHIGKRVLLVDADMRRPSLTKRLGVEGTLGLPDVLAGTATNEQAVLKTTVPGVDVLPTFDRNGAHNPELIANGAFGKCLQQWKNRYDFVLLDSPPVLPVADARIIAGQVDGAILTLRASHCRKADALDAVALLASSGCRPLGTILVGAEKSLTYGGRYGGVYGYEAQAAV